MTSLFSALIAVILYLAVTLIIGLYSYRLDRKTPDDYFLADRRIGPFVLFFTLIATNFSAFFFLGFAGAGYRIGYSYYGMMAMGTAFVALAFYGIGRPVWKLGKTRGYITPPEMLGDLLNSKLLRLTVLLVMVVFTVPYLAIQPIGAGILLSTLTKNLIPYFPGAVLLTAIIVLYVFVGGMRSVVWTDVMQGMVMFFLMLLAVYIITGAFGGLGHANSVVRKIEPELFSHQGVGVFFTPQKWFSYIVLWFVCIPMFPQIFMRFFMAKKSSSLKLSAIAYPTVTAIWFICPVIIGIIGHIPFPGLEGKEADQILPMMLGAYAPPWLAGLIMVGAVAAFMSTMDSQLLTLSSMLTRDLYVAFFSRKASLPSQVIAGRVIVVIMAVIGLAIAWDPPASIFQIATATFTGLAVLFPTVVAALYWHRTSAAACIISIICGEALLVAILSGSIPHEWTLGFLPVIPILLVSTAILIAGSWLAAGFAVLFKKNKHNTSHR